jgi:hypothetical protein
MISGSGNYRHRHSRGRDGQGGRHASTGRDPDTWSEYEPDTWAGHEADAGPEYEPNTWPEPAPHARIAPTPTPWSERGPDPRLGPTPNSRPEPAPNFWSEREPNTWTEVPPRRRPLRARVVVPVAIPMALALALGMVLALSGKPSVARLDQSALGVTAGQNGQNGNAGGNVNASQVTSTANPAQRCQLVVPLNALTAQGLATPWELTGPDGESPANSGCEQSNPDLRAFVQATILDPATGALYVYEPLVVTLGSTPAVTPAVPKLPADAVVDITVGFTGHGVQLAGAGPATLTNQKCVDGTDGSLFGQVAYCNGEVFFEAADQAIADGKLKVPASGDSPVTGQACPTARSFALAGQDLGEGVTSEYLLTATGATAQNSAADRAALPGTTAIADVGEARVLDDAVLPALGCAGFTAPDLSAGGTPGTSQTLEELSAAQNQRTPIALVPENDPVTMINGESSFVKQTLFREGIGQSFDTPQEDTPANFCANMLNIGTAFLAANSTRFFATASPVPAVGNNLFTYLASRLSASYKNLHCASYGLANTVRLVSRNGVATGAILTVTTQQPGTGQPGSTGTSPGQAQPQPTTSEPGTGPTNPGGNVIWWDPTS